MRLSALQKYIMVESYLSKAAKLGRKKFEKFYKDTKQPKEIVNALTKSLERLIDRELMMGYGTRTPHKWYIKEVKLTPLGRRIAKTLLGQQQKLPFKKKIRSTKSEARNKFK